MEFAEFRDIAIQTWLRGNGAQLVELIRRNKLNEKEREFVARIVSGDAPKRAAGRKRTSAKPMRTGLIRFWRRDVDGWQEKDAVYKDIEIILGIKNAMARKWLKQLDAPETLGQVEITCLFQFNLRERQMAISSGDPELIDIYRAIDLKPISDK
jgi:hypothetical protein